MFNLCDEAAGLSVFYVRPTRAIRDAFVKKHIDSKVHDVVLKKSVQCGMTATMAGLPVDLPEV